MRLFQCRNRNQVGVLLALISAVGCGERPDDGQRAGGALIGGTNLLTGRPEVVSWSVGCTATMISSNVFVSAAHCINHAWQATGTAAGTITNTALGQGPIPVERVFSQGLADALSSTDPDDIAFGRLAAPMAGINPAAISTVEPTAGWLTAVGYGCTNRSSCNPARTYIQYFYDGSTPSNIADHGDSGGPTFIGQLNDNGPIVRLASGSTNLGGFGHDVGSDAVRYRPQIQAMSAALNADGVSYRGHVQGIGWQSATSNSQVMGTMGQSLRLEGVQIWSETPGVVPVYRAFVQNVGWQQEAVAGALAGTVGQGLRMEALQVRLAARGPFSKVWYRVYLQDIGWQAWVSEGQACRVNADCPTLLCANDSFCAAGTTGQSRRIEAVRVEVVR